MVDGRNYKVTHEGRTYYTVTIALINKGDNSHPTWYPRSRAITFIF